MKIKKNLISSLILIVLFIFSFFSVMSLYISLILILFLLKFKIDGSVKGIIFITIRSIINPGISVDIGNAQTLKWLILLIFCAFILINSDKSSYKKISKVAFCCGIFLIYSLIVSFVFGSLPIVSLFKIISFFIVFLSCILALQEIHFDLIVFLYKIFSSLIIIGLLFEPMPFSYLRNGYSFQGVTNHPNMLGMVAVITTALVVFLIVSYKENIKINIIIYILTFYSCYLTNARTSMFSILFITLVAFFLSKSKNNIKFLLGMVVLLIIIILLNNETILNTILDFIYKGQTNETGIFNSREEQLGTLVNDFKNNKIFGNGFGTPVLNEKNYNFALSYPKESGNLIFAVLAEGGIIGMLLFSLFYMSIFIKGKFNLKILFPLILFLISMGEMIFFSANNITPILYLLVGSYLAKDSQKIIVYD